MTAAAKLDYTNDIADIRRTLCENGYLHIPVFDKGPRIKGWAKKRIKADQVDGYLRHHADHLRTGILCGNDLVAIDVDAPTQAACDKLTARLMEIPTAAHAPRRTGKPPKCLFLFRAAEPGTKCITSAFMVDGAKHQVEILRDGQQFVAFGDHVETGQPYTWANGSPLDIKATDLPVITNEQIAALLADSERILAEFGERVKEERKPKRSTGGDSFWQRVNAAALASPDRWVKALFPGAQHQPGTGAWRVSSKELGRGLQEDISIHPDGVQDFGREQGATPIELVKEFGGAPSAKDAAFWLCEQIGIAPADLGWEQRSPVVMSFGQALVTPPAANDDDDVQQLYRTDDKLADLTRPGGFVEELIDWIVSSAERPSRELALSAVLPFVGALIGRRFAGSRNARSNLYVVALASSGYGKDHARQQLKRLIAAENLYAFSGPAKFMSSSALRETLQEKPSPFCMMDEYGGPLREMLSPRAGPHQAMLKHDMMEFFTSASTYYEGAAYAKVKAVRIENPNLCIYGTTTQADFWDAVSGISTLDGFLARFLMFNIEGEKPRRVAPSRTVQDIPKSIRTKVKMLAMAGRDPNMDVPGMDSGSKARSAIQVAMSSGAQKRLAEFGADIDRKLKKASPADSSILNRAVEHAAKLALVVSVATDWVRPEIAERHVSWACQLSWLSCCAMMREAALNVADTQRERNVNTILKLLRTAGAKGLPTGQIGRRAPGIEKRQRGEILEDLADGGAIVVQEIKPTEKGGRPYYRVWLREMFVQSEPSA